jgi:hypothetical protein
MLCRHDTQAPEKTTYAVAKIFFQTLTRLSFKASSDSLSRRCPASLFSRPLIFFQKK